MEKGPSLESNYQDAFENYMRYFDLSDEDLKKPLLDVGAGSGEFIKYVRTKLGNKDAFALDKHRHQDGVSPDIVAEGTQLPFADNTFEIVLAKHYLPMFLNESDEMRQALLELVRVAKSGGKVMGDIFTPEEVQGFIDSEFDEKIASKEWLEQRLEGAKDLQVLLKELESTGFKIDLKSKPGKSSDEVVTIQKP